MDSYIQLSGSNTTQAKWATETYVHILPSATKLWKNKQ